MFAPPPLVRGAARARLPLRTGRRRRSARRRSRASPATGRTAIRESRCSRPRRADRGATSTSSSRISRKDAAAIPRCRRWPRTFPRDDMIALGNFFAAQKPLPIEFKADGARVDAGRKISDAVLCPMCHLGGFVGQNEIPKRRRPVSGVRPEAAAGLQGQAAHQRRRQHDERRRHAFRRRHRKPGALHRQPELACAGAIAHSRPI